MLRAGRSLGVIVAAAACLAACTATSRPASSASLPVTSASTITPPAAASSTSSSTPAVPTSQAPATPATTIALPAPPSSAWPMYNRSIDRAGYAPGVPRPAALRQAWSQPVDGAVYGEPLVVGQSVIVATEHDSVYALDLANGAVRWRKNLGVPVALGDLPCGDIDPLGITSTPVYDATTGSIFVVAETTGGRHDLAALDGLTGRLRWTRNLDVGGRDRLAQQQRGALAIANGRVYVAFGGLYGDCGDYIGYVTATSTSGTGDTERYTVPTAREGGIWAPSGPAVAADGTVYVAVGNGAATGGAFDGSDAVLRLSADLASRLDFFAPSGWAGENATDADLGSAGPLLLAGGRVVQSGKDDTVFLLDASHLGGVGGARALARGCAAFGGLAADGSAVFIPCTSGLTRFDVSATTLVRRWSAAATGSPVVGGGAVWSLDTGDGVLHAYDEATGAALAELQVGTVTRFSAPVVVASTVLVGTQRSVTAAHIVAAR